MIVFLTLLYVALLVGAEKAGLIRWTAFWKVSPLLWMLLLFAFLFVPMQWGAPAGTVNVYQPVVEIIPNVSGEVIAVPVKGLQRLEQGDVLFRIDPEPFEIALESARSDLADAKQRVAQLEASSEAARLEVQSTQDQVDVLKANRRIAAASVEGAVAAVNEAKGQREKALAAVEDQKVQLAAGEREYERLKRLAEKQAVSDSDVDIAEIQVTRLRSQLTLTEVEVRVATETVTRQMANQAAAEANVSSIDLQLTQLVESDLPRVKAQAMEAELAATSMIGNTHTLIVSASKAVERAEYDLEQTTVIAPSDGYVIGATLRPGQRVANLPLRSWMSFVVTEDPYFAIGVPQYMARHVRSGQEVELTFKVLPGKTFTGSVDGIGAITPEGQLSPSGSVTPAPSPSMSASPFGIRVKLDERDAAELARFPGGSLGTGAVYTDRMKATHIIRKVMIRMQAWMNYVVP